MALMWTIALLGAACAQVVLGDVEPDPKANNLTQDPFFIDEDNLFTPNFEQSILSSHKFSITPKDIDLKVNASSRNFLSLDEKCHNGMSLSAAWLSYGPYSNMFPTDNPDGVGVQGIFPNIISQGIRACCANTTAVTRGRFDIAIKDLENVLVKPSIYDFHFPITVVGWDTKTFKEMPVIPIVRSPRIALLIHDETQPQKTKELIGTVGKAWPILVFIVVAATISGIFIWVLDRLQNPDEFPRPFLKGTWEGFWWAFVTMTTVGYGDRAPKSILARIFCIMWILCGIIIIAVFTAIITASLSASIQHHFIIHGSMIGAIEGSEEYRLGVSMNAEMKPYKKVGDMLEDLLVDKITGILIDSYVLTFYRHFIKDVPIRIEETIEHKITYGVVLGPNSTVFGDCMSRYIDNHPQEVFEVIANNLPPLKNPTDQVSQEVKASHELFFFSEPMFQNILYTLIAILGCLVALGAAWEFIYHRPRRLRRMKKNNASGLNDLNDFGSKRNGCNMLMFTTCRGGSTQDIQKIDQIKARSLRIKHLIKEYEEFYEKWLRKLKAVEQDEDLNIANGTELLTSL